MVQALRVRVLGGLRVEGIDPRALGSRKARTLLLALALARGRPVSADALIDIVWGDSPPAEPEDQLRVLVSRLRAVVGPDRLPRTDAGYQLRCDWLDIDAASALAEEAARRLESASHGSARAAARGALELLTNGPPGEGSEAGWVDGERASVERLTTRVREIAARAALADGDAQDAVELAEAMLESDPYDEPALRLVMTALARTGRTPAALLRYERMRERLSKELGVDISRESQALHLEVLTGRVAAPVTSGAGPSLPGRTAALALLDEALAESARGTARIVVVEGDAGMGKTRLLTTWGERARAAGATVIIGRCDELGRSLPLQPVLDALAGHLRQAGADAAAAAVGTDADLLGPLLDWREQPRDAELAATLAMPTTAVNQEIVFGALLRVLERLAGGRSIALLLDDLHLGREATLDWLGYVERRDPAIALLVVGALRPEPGRRPRGHRFLELAPLDLEAVEAIAGSDRSASLLERSGGNPLFVLELMKHTGDELPVSLREAVWAQCERAGAAAETLRAAGVVGPEVDVDLLAGALQLPAATLLDHLEEGVRRRILEERGGRFRFRHELVREAIQASSGAARRSLIHRETARALTARSHASPLDVAYHARLAGEIGMAAEALVQAARISADRYAYSEAERLLDDALALQDSVDARLLRARLRMLRSDLPAARDDADAAIAAGGGPPAYEVAAAIAYYRRDLASALALADEGVRCATEPGLRTGCLLISARALHAVGRLGAAAERAIQGVEEARHAGAPIPAMVLGTIRIQQGYASEAYDMLTRVGGGLDVAARRFVAFSPLHAHFITAYALGTLGRVEEALARLDTGARAVERLELRRYVGVADGWRGWLLRQVGHLAEADERNLAAAAAGRAADYREAEVYALLDLVDGRLVAGDLDGAGVRLEEVDSRMGEEYAYRWRNRLRAGWLRARLKLALGDAHGAASTAAGVAEAAAGHGAARYEVLGRLVEERARSELGETVDRSSNAELLGRLDGLAGPEAWWVTAEHAAAFDVDRWWELAGERVARLATSAGPRADAFRTYAGTRLERIRTEGRRGAGRSPTAASDSSRSRRASAGERDATKGAR